MSEPVHARRSGGRYYDIRGEHYWSVTTILDAIPKKALTYWAAREVANWVADNSRAVVELLQTDRDAAIETMKDAPWRKSGKARDLGSDLHALIENYVLGTPMPIWTDQEAPYLAHALEFLRRFDVEIEMSEATVANHEWHYAGTLDVIGTIHADPSAPRLILDWKTGKDVYPEVALQLSAYRFADVVVMPDGSEVQMPEVAGAGAVNLTPQGFRFYPVRADREVFQRFLFVREVFKWISGERTSVSAKNVLGQPVRPPAPKLEVAQ